MITCPLSDRVFVPRIDNDRYVDVGRVERPTLFLILFIPGMISCIRPKDDPSFPPPSVYDLLNRTYLCTSFITYLYTCTRTASDPQILAIRTLNFFEHCDADK